MSKDDDVTYQQALDEFNLGTLSSRRDRFCLKFAKNCVKHNKAKDLFPWNLD